MNYNGGNSISRMMRTGAALAITLPRHHCIGLARDQRVDIDQRQIAAAIAAVDGSFLPLHDGEG